MKNILNHRIKLLILQSADIELDCEPEDYTSYKKYQEDLKRMIDDEFTWFEQRDFEEVIERCEEIRDVLGKNDLELLDAYYDQHEIGRI